MNGKQVLNNLIGKEISAIGTEISSSFELNVKNSMSIEIPLKIIIDDYSIFIYNKWKIISSSDIILSELNGKYIKDISENDTLLRFTLDNGVALEVDLTDDGYMGPEAMTIYGPNNLIMVWQ